jgi:PAS domain-containing protein
MWRQDMILLVYGVVRALPQPTAILGNTNMSEEIPNVERLQQELSELRHKVSELETSAENLTAQNRSLRESEERFQLMIQSVKDHAIFMFDADGRIVNWNDGARS